MNYLLKNFIIIVLCILAVLSVYFGSYLPLKKAQAYIKAIQTVSQAKTVQEFEENYNRALEYFSPIGDEEIVKFLGNNILGIINQPNQPEAVTRELVRYVEPFFLQNNVRHLMTLGNMYEVLWRNFNKENDYLAAESYLKSALEIGPKLPPVLFGLFDLYRMKGDVVKGNDMAAIILGYWPDAIQTAPASQ